MTDILLAPETKLSLQKNSALQLLTLSVTPFYAREKGFSFWLRMIKSVIKQRDVIAAVAYLTVGMHLLFPDDLLVCLFTLPRVKSFFLEEPYYYYHYYCYSFSSFSHRCKLMVSHWSLSDCKSLQIYKNIFSIQWRCNLDGILSSSNFQVLQSLYQSFGDYTKSTSYNWHHRHFHVPVFSFA